MLFLILSIICSVLVGILFKIVQPNFSESFLMISLNYFIAILLSFYFFDIKTVDFNLKFELIIPLIILMPTIFYIFNLSIRKSGIVKTDISQRISLLIPITASFLFFGESISMIKWFGIAIGFCAVFLMLNKTNKHSKFDAKYLILVFLGYGFIDVLFKQIALQKTQPYVNYLYYIFIGAFIVSVIILTISKSKVLKFNQKNIFNGLILGILNFLNIYFYLKAHTLFNDNPSTVFAIMNFGVISIATIIGVVFFKEKFSKNNIIGIILAIISISLIVFSQFFEFQF